MSECTGLFPHSLDPKNCSICRAAATQEDLIKMEKEANVDFLFSDIPDEPLTRFNSDMIHIARGTFVGPLKPRIESIARKTTWLDKWKYRIKNWLRDKIDQW